MFTGLIEAMGEVVGLARGEGVARLTIAERPGAGVVGRLRLGDSVAVSGVCLTALEVEAGAFPPRFSADLAAETLARTTLGRLEAGSVVNLELPTPAGAPLGGHVVQGHVDGVGTLVALDAVRPDVAGSRGSETDWVLRVRLAEGLRRYVVEKGSIAVEGISLTVAGVNGDEIWIAILPHTYRATNLHALRVGMGVNVEVDVLAKYAVGRELTEGRELTVEYLLANGY
jgi:riboflavin synthase